MARARLMNGVLLSVLALACTPVSGLAAIRELPVPRVTINANDVITPEGIVTRKFRTTDNSIRGIALAPGDVVGFEARRRLVAGKPIPLSALRRPTVIRRGQHVEARLAREGLSISATLVALDDGTAGDEIGARNPKTGIVIRATVQSDGTLSVGEP